VKDNNRHKSEQKGYTLIELIAVVALLTVVSAYFISRFSFSSEWAVRDSISQFANTIEYLKIDSKARQVRYLVEINIRENSYRVWQLMTPLTNSSEQVDTLSGFRTKEEAKRQKEKQTKDALENISNNYAQEAANDALPLEDQFYAMIYSWTEDDGIKVPPLDSPSLVEPKYFSPELKIADYQLGANNLMDNKDVDSIQIPIYPNVGGIPFSISFQTATGIIRISSRVGKKGLIYENL
jgi:prepilin-type N-terminal cleavage/methylation domain-containing protein